MRSIEDRAGIPTTGQLAFRKDGANSDDPRPRVISGSFWASPEQEEAYLRAVREIQPWNHDQKRRELNAERRPGAEEWMGIGHILAEIAELADGISAGIRTVPATRQTRADHDARLSVLRDQARSLFE